MKRLFIIWIFIFMVFCYPNIVKALDFLPNGKSGILIEANSGKIIYEKNIHERFSVASMTKMVAQIIIMEELENKRIHLDDIVTVSHNASSMGGSQIYLEEGEKISVEDLLKGISVASGNDATVAMAEYISGSEEKFVERMNQYVLKMNLKNTHFVNCTGLDEENHYSSSYDMAMIARELVINHPQILSYSSIYEDYLRENTSNKFWLVNTNKLIRFYDGADGLKTGHTDDAGYCLAATAKRGNLRLVGIVLGEDDSKIRNQEMMELLDYGFQTVKLRCLKDSGSTVENISFNLGKPSSASAILKDDLCVVEDKDMSLKYDYKVELDNINIPIKKGDKVGIIKVLYNGDVVAKSSLLIDNDVNKMKLLEFYYIHLINVLKGIF